MSQKISSNLLLEAPLPIDNRSGILEDGIWRPYNDLQEFNDTIPEELKFNGLQIFVKDPDELNKALLYFVGEDKTAYEYRGEKGDKGEQGTAGTANFVTWSPTTFTNGSQVVHNGQIWEANSDTLSSDVPSVSSKWSVFLDYTSIEFVADSVNITNEFFEKLPPQFIGVENYPIGTASFQDTASIFSGWGCSVGVYQNFNAVKTRIKSRATAITSVYYEIRKSTSTGDLITSGTLAVNIASNTYQDVIFLLSSTIENSSSDVIWFGYKCNQLCDRFGSVPTASPAYSSAYVTNGNQSVGNWLATLGRNIWASIGTYNSEYSISEKMLDSLSDNDTNYAELPETTEKVKESILLENVFEGAEIFSESFASVINNDSVFSGWGSPIGIQKNFSHILCKIQARSIPITSIYYEIRENNSVGSIIKSNTISVNLPINTLSEVTFPMGEFIDNIDNKQLWFGYKCNQFCGLYGNYGNTFLTPTYGVAAYATNGTLTPDYWLNVVAPGTRNMWCKVGVSEIKPVPTNDFTEEIARKLELPNFNSDIPEIILPDKIYAIVGDTLQLFYRGMIKAVNPYNYNIIVNCNKGRYYNRYFEYTPIVGDVGTVSFTIKVKNNGGEVLSTKTCQLITKNAVAQPSAEVNVLTIGDSLTNAKVYPQEALRRLTGSGGTPSGKGYGNIAFRGRKPMVGGGLEGNSGWSWGDYLTIGRSAYTFTTTAPTIMPAIESVYKDANNKEYTMWWDYSTTSLKFIVNDLISVPPTNGVLTKVSGIGDATITFSSRVASSGNPFWNDTTNSLDITTYVNKWCSSKLNTVYILLTWNSQYGNRTDFSIFTNYAKTFFDHIHANYPLVKIKLMGVQVPDLKGGVWVYGAPQENTITDQYGMIVTALNMNKAYQDLANDPAYSSFVEFVNVSTQFDSEYNMPYSPKNVNTRNTVTENVGTNEVHPDTNGYLQIGDVVYRNFIANYCQ